LHAVNKRSLGCPGRSIVVSPIVSTFSSNSDSSDGLVDTSVSSSSSPSSTVEANVSSVVVKNGDSVEAVVDKVVERDWRILDDSSC